MSGEPLANTAAGSAALGVGTFLLADNRETVESGGMVIGNARYKTYLVRRLADGNCWMVQNLDLDLSNFTSNKTARLTPENTDVSETWIPDKTLKDAHGYANLEGLTDTLEPGPDYATLGSFSINDPSVNYQFQPRLYYGRNLYWGSRYHMESNVLTANTSSTSGAQQDHKTGVYLLDNALADYPRSYNNDWGYIGGTSKVADPDGCAAIEGNSAVWSEKCIMPGAITDALGNNATIPQEDDGSLLIDSTWQPSYISDNNSATFTMRGSMYLGDYYNYYSATAGTGRYDMTSTGSQKAKGSICPKGWMLPNLNSDERGSWLKLFASVYDYVETNGYAQRNRDALNKMMQLPTSIISSGVYGWSNGSLNYRGSHGSYWTSYSNSISANGFGRSMYINNGGYIHLSNYADKAHGASIRCISRGTEANSVQPTQEDPIITCAANNICYDANGGTGNAMANTAGATFGSSKVLSAPTYTRTGYAFVGWSESKDAVKSGAYIYGPNETITVPNLSSEGMTLYAQWLAPENSSYTMQAFGRNETVKTCATMTDGNNGTTEERIALRDERDDNVYIVTKLKDGNCWMTSNLALNLADFAGKTTGTLLTPENTDLTASREDLSTLTIEGVFS